MKKFCQKTIAYLRSTEIYNDSRATKEIESYSTEYNLLVFGWNSLDKNIDLDNTDKVKYSFFDKNAKYGSGIKNLVNILKFNLWLKKQLIDNIEKIDVIHACDLDTAIVGQYIANKYKKKLIYDIYDYYTECHNFGFLKSFVEKIDINIINKADVVLLCTEKRRNQINKANPKKVEIIHNSPKAFEIEHQADDSGKIIVGYFGILQDDRLLIEISKEIIKEKEIILHIGGFGKYEEYFENLAKEHTNIVYYGALKYAEVLQKESKCNILFATYNPSVPNHRYSAPNKVYEAMALNLPVIVCKNTGIDELVINEKIGYAIDYDAKDFIKAIKKINSIDFSNNKAIFEKKYSWNVMESKLLKIINEI